eukprot:CAMPEP_0178386348 /NCGR_PEP_ID=MMETSP0689_2-20121128/8515_1 /TAXON_ID=160604 /ORGANISM="Amphidinium massartii, Strain CS-259" /LENGTH=77 /DNA_ID=CAMNT_0020006685 /DNA_START=220 /DNA_END=453 /DNA_ORIENTATION=+
MPEEATSLLAAAPLQRQWATARGLKRALTEGAWPECLITRVMTHVMPWLPLSGLLAVHALGRDPSAKQRQQASLDAT